MGRPILAVLILAAAMPAFGQSDRSTQFMDNCRRNHGGKDERFCETRAYTVAAAKALTVDGRQNGGISVHGWDRPDVKVVAMIEATGDDVAEAQATVKQINVVAGGGEVRADGPRIGSRNSWSVSYEIWAPRTTDLMLTANNGGISVQSIVSHVQAETQNGGISLNDVHGDVRGVTVNGGITAELTGERWMGAGLDLRTSNGGVRLTIPTVYSATLETGTVNGGVHGDFPMTVQGRADRHQFSTTLGAGGPVVRATTTNGGISIHRK
jgi:hypothetical protein